MPLTDIQVSNSRTTNVERRDVQGPLRRLHRPGSIFQLDQRLTLHDRQSQPTLLRGANTHRSVQHHHSIPTFPPIHERMAQTPGYSANVGGIQSHAPCGKKSKRDNGVVPISAHANNANGGAAAEALNNLSATTAADRQAAANQLEAVANLAGANQKLTHQLQQAQQQIQNMMTKLHLPRTAPARSYHPPPQKLAPVAAHIPATSGPALLNQGDQNRFRGNQPPHATRRWDNGNYCSSCGFGVAEWHTSHTFPPSRYRPDHN